MVDIYEIKLNKSNSITWMKKYLKNQFSNILVQFQGLR